ncbi:MAG: DUF2079 domain-containing protein [Candidatus Uhrbacteria bacterium]
MSLTFLPRTTEGHGCKAVDEKGVQIRMGVPKCHGCKSVVWGLRPRYGIAIAIILFTVAVSAVGFWKYSYYRYQGLDLAIYTNVLWNLSYPTPSNSPSPGEGEKNISPPPIGRGGEGGWGWGDWYSSIQANSYLGDHVEPILFLLAPIFRLWSDPRLLIILQALALALTAIPVYLLLTMYFREQKHQAPSTKLQISTKHQAPNYKCTERSFFCSSIGNWILNIVWSLVLGIWKLSKQFVLSRPNNPAILLVGLWLLNPLLWNTALFEFHALAFAPVLVLTAAYFFQRRKFWWFLAFAIASVLVREDVALIVAMFGVVAFMRHRRTLDGVAARIGIVGWHRPYDRVVSRNEGFERRGGATSPPVLPRRMAGAGGHVGPPLRRRDASRPAARMGSLFFNGQHWLRLVRSWRWIIVPILFGAVWFLIASRIAASHNLAGHYKYLIYYGWLRDALAHPASLLGHFVTIGNVEMLLGLLLPFVFLPLLRPTWLLLAVPATLQILLAAPGGSGVVVMTHYSLLFLPALALATIEAVRRWNDRPIPQWVARIFPTEPRFIVVLGVLAAMYVALALGPWTGIATIVTRGASADDHARRAAYDELLARVPPDAAIAASYAALPHVAARRDVASMATAYLGVTQFGERSYVLPEQIAYLIMDARDAVAYAAQFPSVGWAASHAASGPARLQQIISERGFRVVGERNGLVLLARPNFAEQSLGGLARDDAGAPLDKRFIETVEPLRGVLVVDELRDIRLEQ